MAPLTLNLVGFTSRFTGMFANITGKFTNILGLICIGIDHCISIIFHASYSTCMVFFFRGSSNRGITRSR